MQISFQNVKKSNNHLKFKENSVKKMKNKIKHSHKVYIITGSSSGFGFEIVKHILKEGSLVIGLSRSKALFRNPLFFQYQMDFKKPFQKKINLIFKKHNQHFQNTKEIILINNAATIHPIHQVGQFEEKEISEHIQINLVSLIVISNFFIHKFKNSSQNKLIVQITSGAAQNAIAGWSLYCASKSAVNMFNDSLNFELSPESMVKTVTYSPGVMDTQMQKNIRSRTKKQFPQVEKFKQMKIDKNLKSPNLVALDLLDIISNFKNIKPGDKYRVRI